jgi:2-polyprenyl-3-methyl-5-hydroxy-6-metoxy-1,4-benzoquinol methylase
VLTYDEYLSLNPGYDPGPIEAFSDPESLRRFLQVDNKKIFLRKYIRPSAPARPRLLDIGCGAGGYLLAGRELGFEVSGLEPSAEHSQIAREQLGFPVQTAYFQRDLLPSSSFDVIVLSHVIEPIYDPKSFLADVVDLLAPDGVLVVVTPNAARSPSGVPSIPGNLLRACSPLFER